MSSGFMPGLFVCAFMVALAPVSVPALAQSTGSGSATRTAAAAPDAADDKEARDLFEIGKDAFDEGRFERALKYFQEAYALSHRAALLSNIGTAFDRLRRDQEALDAYRKYLEQVPEAQNRRLVEERIRIIESALARSQPAAPAPVPIETPATPTSADKAQAPQPTAAHAELAPTPQETARASQRPNEPSDPRRPSDVGSSPVTARWWFWTGIGAVAIAAVVVVVAVSAGGSSPAQERPTLLDPQTRVREL